MKWSALSLRIQKALTKRIIIKAQRFVGWMKNTRQGRYDIKANGIIWG